MTDASKLVGKRVQHVTTGERGTVREVHRRELVVVAWEGSGSGLARVRHLTVLAAPSPEAGE